MSNRKESLTRLAIYGPFVLFHVLSAGYVITGGMMLSEGFTKQCDNNSLWVYDIISVFYTLFRMCVVKWCSSFFLKNINSYIYILIICSFTELIICGVGYIEVFNKSICPNYKDLVLLGYISVFSQLGMVIILWIWIWILTIFNTCFKEKFDRIRNKIQIEVNKLEDSYVEFH